jgi:hypothetical protein
VDSTNYRIEPDRITIHPQWGTGWQTVLNHLKQEIVMRPCILGIRLPLRRRITYPQVREVTTACREVWWASGILGMARSKNPIELLRTLIDIRDVVTVRTKMPERGWRYDILVTIKGGKRFIKLGTLKSPDTASDLAEECRQRVGLSDT